MSRSEKQLSVLRFKDLMGLTRIDPTSIAAQGAALVLVNGLTQTEAAKRLNCQQATISRAVRRLRDVERIARNLA
jgi:DNA-binding MarR family transcriptional regulator